MIQAVLGIYYAQHRFLRFRYGPWGGAGNGLSPRATLPETTFPLSRSCTLTTKYIIMISSLTLKQSIVIVDFTILR